jgi:hypothetical protein
MSQRIILNARFARSRQRRTVPEKGFEVGWGRLEGLVFRLKLPFGWLRTFGKLTLPRFSFAYPCLPNYNVGICRTIRFLS